MCRHRYGRRRPRPPCCPRQHHPCEIGNARLHTTIQNRDRDATAFRQWPDLLLDAPRREPPLVRAGLQGRGGTGRGHRQRDERGPKHDRRHTPHPRHSSPSSARQRMPRGSRPCRRSQDHEMARHSAEISRSPAAPRRPRWHPRNPRPRSASLVLTLLAALPAADTADHWQTGHAAAWPYPRRPPHRLPPPPHRRGRCLRQRTAQCPRRRPCRRAPRCPGSAGRRGHRSPPPATAAEATRA